MRITQNERLTVYLYYLRASSPNASLLQVSEEDTEQRQGSEGDPSDPYAAVDAEDAPRLSPSEKQFLAQLVTGQMPAQQAKNWFRKSAPAISSQFPPGSGDVDLSGIQGRMDGWSDAWSHFAQHESGGSYQFIIASRIVTA